LKRIHPDWEGSSLAWWLLDDGSWVVITLGGDGVYHDPPDADLLASLEADETWEEVRFSPPLGYDQDMEQYQCKCIGFGRVCGGCAASLDMQAQERALEAFDEAAAAVAIREAGLDACAPTLRSRELAGVPHVSRSGL
jgi:hypothetical protein